MSRKIRLKTKADAPNQFEQMSIEEVQEILEWVNPSANFQAIVSAVCSELGAKEGEKLLTAYFTEAISRTIENIEGNYRFNIGSLIHFARLEGFNLREFFQRRKGKNSSS